MKTIQEHIQELNKDVLIANYIYSYPISFQFEKDIKNIKYLSIQEIWNRMYNNVSRLIDKIINTKAKPNEMVYFAHKCDSFSGDFDDVMFSLVKKEDVLTNKDVDKIITYCQIYEPLENTIGNLVSESYLTQRNITDLCTHFIHENSWFGFNQECLEFERKKLENILEDYEENKDNEDYFLTIDEVFEKLNIDREIRDAEEEKAYQKYIHARNEYNKQAFSIEINKLKLELECEKT